MRPTWIRRIGNSYSMWAIPAIQALISYAITGDDRLAKQALASFDDSRIPEGLTQSRYPTSQPQIIPTFSLIWIGMLHDYWMYRPDESVVKARLPGTRTVLEWFSHYEQPDGLLRKLPWWSFIDWVSRGELPTYDAQGESCTTTLHYLGALDDAAELEKAVGDRIVRPRRGCGRSMCAAVCTRNAGMRAGSWWRTILRTRRSASSRMCWQCCTT